jgi:hypothetical protein
MHFLDLNSTLFILCYYFYLLLFQLSTSFEFLQTLFNLAFYLTPQKILLCKFVNHCCTLRCHAIFPLNSNYYLFYYCLLFKLYCSFASSIFAHSFYLPSFHILIFSSCILIFIELNF